MKNKLIVISVLLIVAVIATIVISRLHEFKKQITTGITHEQDTTEHWRDDFNQEHAKNVSFQQDLAVVKLLHQDELKKVADLLAVKQKQIENLNRVVANIKGSFTAQVDTTRRGDTTASAVHVDTFTVFKTVTVDNKETVSYSVRVPIHLTQYWKRPHSFLGIKFGDPVHFIDGYSDNPNVTLDSLSNVRILTKPPGRWGAGPVVGFMTNGGRFTWSLGVGVSYSLIRW